MFTDPDKKVGSCFPLRLPFSYQQMSLELHRSAAWGLLGIVELYHEAAGSHSSDDLYENEDNEI